MRQAYGWQNGPTDEEQSGRMSKLIGWQFPQLSDQFGSRVGPNPLGVEGTALGARG
jgi:hypothetical protein